jgi:Ca2+-binding EF-hand superfamily protein
MAAASVLTGGHDVDWAAIAALLPTGRDKPSKQRRRDLFARWDVNENGCLSLAEIDRGLHTTLGLEEIDGSKPVIMRAFTAARDANRRTRPEAKRRDDYVERDEFRLLMCYLRIYFEIFVAFNRVDASFDGRISLDEFKRALALLNAWGVRVSEAHAEAEFAKIDENGGGSILFDEFACTARARSRLGAVSAQLVLVM